MSNLGIFEYTLLQIDCKYIGQNYKCVLPHVYKLSLIQCELNIHRKPNHSINYVVAACGSFQVRLLL